MANVAFCQLCQMLNQPRTHLQWYHDIDAFYDGGNHCHKPNRFKVLIHLYFNSILLIPVHFEFDTIKVPIKQFDFDNYTIPADAVIKIPL